MPTGIFKHKPHSEETKQKMSLVAKGKKKSEEHKRNLSLSKLGKPGHPHTEESRRKIGNANRGKRRPDLSKRNRSPQNPFWKGGIASKNNIIRHSLEYKLWRDAVFKRDNYTCIWCGDNRGGNLNADHIKPFAYFPELRFAIDNGRTLCINCHKTTDTYLKKSQQTPKKRNWFNDFWSNLW